MEMLRPYTVTTNIRGKKNEHAKSAGYWHQTSYGEEKYNYKYGVIFILTQDLHGYETLLYPIVCFAVVGKKHTRKNINVNCY